MAKDIIQSIISQPEYDEDTAKAFLERILEDLADEKLREERRERLAEQERQDRLLAEERAYELERLKLTSAAESASLASTSSTRTEETVRYVNIERPRTEI